MHNLAQIKAYKIKQLFSYCGISFVLLFCIALIVIHYSFNQQIKQQLQTKLAPLLNQAFQQHLYDENYELLVKDNVNQQLKINYSNSYFHLIQQHKLTVKQLLTKENKSSISTISIDWLLGLEPQIATVKIKLFINWWLLILLCAGLSILLTSILLLLPRPLTESNKNWLTLLTKLGMSNESAKTYSHQLDTLPQEAQTSIDYLLTAETLPTNISTEALLSWLLEVQPPRFQQHQLEIFCQALSQSQLNFEQAYQFATQANALTFELETFSIKVNGLTIKLAKTPFFYYLWYAVLKVYKEESAWLTNPLINKPDQKTAHCLLNLMKTFNGHNKSINELETHGLRAKTLDQNRNKIKDALVAQLGEELSQSFLFAIQRNPQTGSFQYQLKLTAAQIRLPQALLPFIKQQLKNINTL